MDNHNIVQIPIRKNPGLFAIVDADDYHLVSAYYWYLLSTPTTKHAWTKINKKTIYIHRLIMQSNSSKPHIDHINRDGLDNRRANLRFATNSENAWNTGVHPRSSSGYKGVCKYHSGKWRAHIRIDNGNRVHLGLFSNPVDAAIAYDNAARKYHGEFAFLNFPEMGERDS